MNVPCRIKALKYVRYGADLEMSAGSYAEVTLEREKNSNTYRMLKVAARNSSAIFTEAALENAIKRGDFTVS